MTADFLTLEEASAISGLHPNSLRRLLRAGTLEGYKAVHGRRRWLVSAASLRAYAPGFKSFPFDVPAPGLVLKKRSEKLT